MRLLALAFFCLFLNLTQALAEVCVTDPFEKSNLSSALNGLREAAPAYPCFFNFEKTGLDIQKKLQEAYPPASASNNAFGGHFKNENPKLLQAFQQLTRGTEVIQKFHIGKDCDTVLCAAKKIWGESVGPKMLYIKAQYGVNTSPFKMPTGDRLKAFTESEIDVLMSTLDTLPSTLFPLNRNGDFPIVRTVRTDTTVGVKGKTISAAGDTDGRTMIRQFSVNKSGGSDSSEDLFTHEIAHTVFSFKGLDFQKRWDELSHWVRKTTGWQSDRKNHFVSDYAKDENNWNADNEDFAESMAAYRHNPAKLMKCCSTKYNFIKKEVFGGMEYLSHNCIGISEENLQRINDQLHPVHGNRTGELDVKRFEACVAQNDVNVLTTEISSCTQDLRRSNVAISSMNPKDLVKKAQGLGVQINEIQAKFILDRLSLNQRAQIGSEQYDKARGVIDTVNQKYLALEKTKLIASREALRTAIGFPNPSADFQKFIGAEGGALISNPQYYMIFVMAKLRAKVPALKVSAAAHVILTDPDFKPEMDFIKNQTIEYYQAEFKLNDPSSNGKNCKTDYAKSKDPDFVDMCMIMMGDGEPHKIDSKKEVKQFFEDRFAGKPIEYHPAPQGTPITGNSGATGSTGPLSPGN